MRTRMTRSSFSASAWASPAVKTILPMAAPGEAGRPLPMTFLDPHPASVGDARRLVEVNQRLHGLDEP